MTDDMYFRFFTILSAAVSNFIVYFTFTLVISLIVIFFLHLPRGCRDESL